MRLRKTASAVEDECLRNIAGSDKQRSAVGITGKEKINQFFAVSPSTTAGNNRNVFKLVNALRLFGNDTFGFDAVVVQNKHVAAVEIPVYHTFLLIGGQQEVEVFSFIAVIQSDDFHSWVYLFLYF